MLPWPIIQESQIDDIVEELLESRRIEAWVNYCSFIISNLVICLAPVPGITRPGRGQKNILENSQ
jgi:hypothetical protein